MFLVLLLALAWACVVKLVDSALNLPTNNIVIITEYYTDVQLREILGAQKFSWIQAHGITVAWSSEYFESTMREGSAHATWLLFKEKDNSTCRMIEIFGKDPDRYDETSKKHYRATQSHCYRSKFLNGKLTNYDPKHN